MTTLLQAKHWYSLDDPVHGYDHICRVHQLAGYIAQMEGADEEIVLTAAILHDLRPPHESMEDFAHEIYAIEKSKQILSSEGWPHEKMEAVIHCIRSHRWRNPLEPPVSLEAKVLFDADKLDAIGAMGSARAIAYAARIGSPIYQKPSQEFLRSGKKVFGEAHSAWHEYYFKLNRIREKLFTPTAKALAEKRAAAMDSFFSALVHEAIVDDANENSRKDINE